MSNLLLTAERSHSVRENSVSPIVAAPTECTWTKKSLNLLQQGYAQPKYWTFSSKIRTATKMLILLLQFHIICKFEVDDQLGGLAYPNLKERSKLISVFRKYLIFRNRWSVHTHTNLKINKISKMYSI